MLYKSAQDVLKADFADFQVQGTSVTEKGLTVSIRPEGGEKVIFFHTDDDTVRNHLHMPPGERRCCDYLVFYAKSNDDYKVEIVCFLELKGNKFKDAVDQVCNTYKYIKEEILEKFVDQKQRTNIINSAYICIHGQAPSTKYALQGRKRLQQTFGSPHNFKINHTRTDRELGIFLRKLHPIQS